MKLDDAIKRYITVARPELLKWFPRNSCIQSTRTTIEVFERLGFKARPLPVAAVVTDAEAETAWATGLTEEEKRRGKITPAAEKGWDGHLVAIVEDLWWIDASLDQASPVIDEVLAFRLPVGSVAEETSVDLEISAGGRKLDLQYRARPSNQSFQHTDAWGLDQSEIAVVRILRKIAGEPVDDDRIIQFVVYHNPPEYVVRRCEISTGTLTMSKQVWGVARSAEGLEILRADFRNAGLVRLERFAEDDATILEVWM